MAIGIIAAQTFTDSRGIDHTSAYGVVTDAHIQPMIRFAQFRIDVFVDQPTAEAGDFNASIATFKINFQGATYDTFFDEDVVMLEDISTLIKAQEAMLAHEVDSVKTIDDTLWEAI